MADKMFLTYGIEDEDFSAALAYYDTMNDPEIMRVIMED